MPFVEPWGQRQGLKQLPRKVLLGCQKYGKRATLGAPFAAFLAQSAPRSSAESPAAAQ